jgi:RND family efflux transporter MFP subunit
MNIDVSWTGPWINLFLLGLVATGSLGCTQATIEQSLIDSDRSTSLVERVTAGPVPKKDLELYSLQPGRVEAYEQAPILSKVAGYVDSVSVDVGDPVRKGDLLILLRAPEYQDQVAAKQGMMDYASAQIKQGQAELLASQAGVRSAAALVEQTQAGIERADAMVQRWESEKKRISELAQKGTVTQQLADETLSQYHAAVAGKKEIEASIASAQAKLLEAQTQVGKAQADLEAAEAKLTVAKSEHALATSMANYLRIVAPFDGVVTSRDVDVGHYVQPVGTSEHRSLMTIAHSNRIRIHVDIPEPEAHYVDAGATGDPVEVLIPAQPSLKLRATISRTSESLDLQSRCLPIQIEVDNSDRKLLTGAFVQAKVLLEEKKDAWTLPIGGIVKKGDEVYCCTVVGGKIEFRPLQLGLRVGDDVEVLSGLSGEEIVVLARAAGLKAGQSVEVLVKK